MSTVCGFVALSYQDSNLDRQNQKLQCYHYTIRQSFAQTMSLKRCKVMGIFRKLQVLAEVFNP